MLGRRRGKRLIEQNLFITGQFDKKPAELLEKLCRQSPALPEEAPVFGQTLTQEGFAWLYDRYFPRLYSYVSCRIATREEAEDIVALVFEQILKNFQTFDSRRGSLDAWIFTIASHAITDRHRSRKRHREQTLDNYAELEDDFSLSDRFLRQEELALLRLFLARLSGRERELLTLRYGAALSHRRIAEIMKMSEGNVAVSLGRALRKLQNYFQHEAEQNEKA